MVCVLETGWNRLCRWHTIVLTTAAAGFLSLCRPEVHHQKPSFTLCGATESLISIPAQLPSSLAFTSGSQEPHYTYCSPGFLFELGYPQHFPAQHPLILFPPSPEGHSHHLAAPGMLCQLHLQPWYLTCQHWHSQRALARALPFSQCSGALESSFS